MVFYVKQVSEEICSWALAAVKFKVSAFLVWGFICRLLAVVVFVVVVVVLFVFVSFFLRQFVFL